MVTAYRDDLFLPFCANFRALIEAAGDGYDALGNVAATLSSHRDLANAALLMKTEQSAICKELEDQLIHFSHGRKLKKGETAPNSHKAKPSAEYVRSLEKMCTPRIYECYSDLCEYTHPGARSVEQLCVREGDCSFILVPGHDEARIERVIARYRELLNPLLMAAFNPGLLVLKVLFYSEATQFHCRSIQGIDLSNVRGWKKYAIQMGVRP